MTKKIVYLLLTLFTSLVLVGCSNKSESKYSNKTIAKSKTTTSEQYIMEPLEFSTQYFEGKKVCIYGDSITFGHTVQNQNNSWVNKLREEIHYNYKNYAINGALLTYVKAIPIPRDSMCEQIELNASYNSTCDYAFIFIGTNDFARQVEIGYNNSDPLRLNEVNSFKEGIIYACKTLRQQNPDIKIIFFTPINRYDRSMVRQDGVTLDDFRDAIVEMSSILHYYYVELRDAFNESQLCDSEEYSIDKLHPNDKGQIYLASYMLKQEIKH